MSTALWYPLDGCWHKSVHRRMSNLHRKSVRGGALCNEELFLLDEDSYTEAEATATGRELCRTCLAKAAK